MAQSGTLARIIRRLDPCKCGCQGKDSWHRRSYTRTLLDKRAEDGRCHVPAMGGEYAYDQVATVEVPWSSAPVRVVQIVHPSARTAGKLIPLGWFFV